MLRYMSTLLGLLLISIQPASALPLQGNALYTCTFQSNSKLYVVNHGNAAKTLVGSIGKQCTDLAFAGSALRGVTFTQFLAINPTNGQVTASFSHGFTDLNALIPVSPSSNFFYAAGFKDSGGKGANFVRINANTGVTTKLGNYGAGLTSAGDLAFFGAKLYATVNKTGSVNTRLATIDTSTGKATLVGANGGNIGFKDVWGLAVRNSIMYGVTKDGKLLRINPSTAVGILQGTNGLVQAGLAKSP